MIRVKIIVLVSLVFILNSINAQESTFSLYGKLNFGPHKVGFKKSSLPNTSSGLNLSLWYPSSSGKKTMKFAEYLDYTSSSTLSDLLRDLSIGIGGKADLFAKDSLLLILNSATKSFRDANRKEEAFPLLIWSIRYETVAYQNILSEFLASHGYIVAFVEDYPNAPSPWQLQSREEKKHVLNDQIQTINTTIDHFKQLPNVDTSKIGLLSWSYAGESAILAQMENPSIDLVIGLSSLNFSSGVYLGQELAEQVTPKHLNVPYLILTQSTRANGTSYQAPTIFQKMHPNSRFISIQPLAHGNFNALEGMIPGLLQTHKVQPWSIGGTIAQVGYETICEMVLKYVSSVFGEKDFEVFDKQISKLENNLPASFFSVQKPQIGDSDMASTNLGVRNAHSMIYHPKESSTYLFGGADHEQVLGDLWRLNNLTWEKMSTPISPAPRTFAAMAYDNADNRIILFGGNKVLFGKGIAASNLLNDTWEYKNGNWAKIHTNKSPPPRAESTMVYDKLNNRIILFGGYTIRDDKIIRLGDTWIFENNEWQLVAEHGPSGRHGTAMVYDEKNHQVLLFGGGTVDKQYGDGMGETWIWEKDSWEKQATNKMPGIFNPAMSYKKDGEEFLIFGGWEGKKRIDHTYSYSNNQWQLIKVINTPPSRNHSQMVYDEKNERILLYGGHNGKAVFGDLWEFKNNNWRQLTTIPAKTRVKNGH